MCGKGGHLLAFLRGFPSRSPTGQPYSDMLSLPSSLRLQRRRAPSNLQGAHLHIQSGSIDFRSSSTKGLSFNGCTRNQNAPNGLSDIQPFEHLDADSFLLQDGVARSVIQALNPISVATLRSCLRSPGPPSHPRRSNEVPSSKGLPAFSRQNLFKMRHLIWVRCAISLVVPYMQQAWWRAVFRGVIRTTGGWNDGNLRRATLSRDQTPDATPSRCAKIERAT